MKVEAKGLIFGATGVVLMCCMDAVVRALGAELTTFQIVFIRMFGAAVWLSIWIALTRGEWPKRSRLPRHLMRGAMLLVVATLFFYAASHLPLAICTALAMTAPVYVTVLAALIFKERISAYGIVALGLQVTFGQIAVLGPVPFAALIVIMTLTMGAGFLGARLSGQTPYAGLLAGGATAICGASAALALYGVIGKNRLSQAQFALTLVGVSLASALAMTIYPLLAGEFGLSDRQAGFLIGASIHDVAQAIGGGYAFSDAAGASATIVKLARVALLAPVVALVGLLLKPEDSGDTRIWRRLALPWFIVAFLAVVTLNSVAPVPDAMRGAALTASKALLLLAVTATAMRTRMDLLLGTGWRAAVPVLFASLTSFAASLLFALVIL